MELLQLRYFFDSSKNESFAKTAQKYMVPPSSVSASVKHLEQELGCRLFDRTGNRIILNENGKKFQQSVCRIFDELDRAVDALNPEKDEREVKMLVRTTRNRITAYMIELKSKYPNLKLVAEFDVEKPDLEGYDIIISSLDDRLDDRSKFCLFSQPMCIQASAHNPLCGRRLTMNSLCNQPFISLGSRSTTHKILIDACHRAGFTPNITVLCNDTGCYQLCLDNNLGIGIGYDGAQSGNIVKLDVTDFDERQDVYVFYRSADMGRNLSRIIEFFKSKAV